MRTSRLTAIGVAVFLGATVTACGNSVAPASEPSAVATAATADQPSELTLDTVNWALSTLQEQTGAPLEEIQLKSLMISPGGSATFDALDPAKPTELNQYVAYPDGRRLVHPYDYGGADNYEALTATLFGAHEVSPETLVAAWQDSFDRVQGERSEMSASGVSASREDETGPVQLSIVNGPQRDRQSVYYDANGQFLRTS